MNRAVGFMRLDQQRKAIPMFQECADHFDFAASDAYTYMVLCHKELYEYEQAIACGLKIPVDQRSIDTEITLGFCHAKLGSWKDALPHYERATQLEPTAANAWENLGRGLFVLGRTRDALSALRRCTDLPEAGIEAWILRAELGAALNIYPDALDALARAHTLRKGASPKTFDRLNALDEFVQFKQQKEQVRVLLGPGFNNRLLDEICVAARETVKQSTNDRNMQIEQLRRRWPAVMYSQAAAILALFRNTSS